MFSVYTFYSYTFFVQPKLTRHGNALNMTLVIPCTRKPETVSHSPTVLESKNMLENVLKKHSVYHSSTASDMFLKFRSICRNLPLAPQSPQSPPKAGRRPSAHNHSLAKPQAMNKHLRSSRTDDQNMMECLQESFGHIIEN